MQIGLQHKPEDMAHTLENYHMKQTITGIHDLYGPKLGIVGQMWTRPKQAYMVKKEYGHIHNRHSLVRNMKQDY